MDDTAPMGTKNNIFIFFIVYFLYLSHIINYYISIYEI